MIAIDTNVLLAFVVTSDKNHVQATHWVDKCHEPFSTTQTNLAESLRLLTHPKVFPKPLSLVTAIDIVEQLVEHYQMLILEESPTWWQDLKGILPSIPGLRGNEIFDARIALCLRYNRVHQICTFDSDFAKYRFLKIVSP